MINYQPVRVPELVLSGEYLSAFLSYGIQEVYQCISIRNEISFP